MDSEDRFSSLPVPVNDYTVGWFVGLIMGLGFKNFEMAMLLAWGRLDHHTVPIVTMVGLASLGLSVVVHQWWSTYSPLPETFKGVGQ